MHVVQQLTQEHRLIRQYLDNLAYALERLEHGQRPPKEFFENALLFMRDFIDGFHHYKEEHQLFVALAAKTKGKYDGALDSLRYQHERGRALVATIAGALQGYNKGDERDVLTVMENASALASLLRQHVNREDSQIYPVCRKELGPADEELLAVEFKKADQKHGADCYERNEDRVEKMAGLWRE